MISLDRDFVARCLPHRPDDAHKGTMGALCSVTGSFGYAGAAVLSARGALRSGVGLHYQVLPEAIYPIYASSVPESVCVPVGGSPYGTVAPTDLDAILNTISRATAVLIGCGMGNTSAAFDVLSGIMKTASVPLIIDADGINALSMHINIMTRMINASPSPIILTPHVKEFSRITQRPVSEILASPVEAARAFCERHPDTVLVLKSHRTLVVRNDTMYLNTAGNSGMAKGGSGDVLAGVIASLAAQGVDPLSAAAAGVHIHALAGDAAAAKHGRTAMLPSDIIDCLSDVYRSLESHTN